MASLQLLDPELRLPHVDLVPKKGHLAITARVPGLLRHQLLAHDYVASAHGDADTTIAFNLQPRTTGQVLIGSSRQRDVDDQAIDRAIIGRMLALATQYLPALANVPITRVWTGVRTATTDDLPLIGPHPTDSTVLLATGHEGLGITTALATATLLVAHVAGTTTDIDPTPYLPGRESEDRAVG